MSRLNSTPLKTNSNVVLLSIVGILFTQKQIYVVRYDICSFLFQMPINFFYQIQFFFSFYANFTFRECVQHSGSYRLLTLNGLCTYLHISNGHNVDTICNRANHLMHGSQSETAQLRILVK